MSQQRRSSLSTHHYRVRCFLSLLLIIHLVVYVTSLPPQFYNEVQQPYYYSSQSQSQPNYYQPSSSNNNYNPSTTESTSQYNYYSPSQPSFYPSSLTPPYYLPSSFSNTFQTSLPSSYPSFLSSSNNAPQQSLSFNPPFNPSPLSRIEPPSATSSYSAQNPSWPFTNSDSHLAPQSTPIQPPLIPFTASSPQQPPLTTWSSSTNIDGGDAIRSIERLPRQDTNQPRGHRARASSLSPTLATTPIPITAAPPLAPLVHYAVIPSTSTAAPFFPVVEDHSSVTYGSHPIFVPTATTASPSFAPPVYVINQSVAPPTTAQPTQPPTISTAAPQPPTSTERLTPIPTEPVNISQEVVRVSSLLDSTGVVETADSQRGQVESIPYSSADIRIAAPTEEPLPTTEESLITTEDELIEEARLQPQEDGFVVRGGVLPFIEIEEEGFEETTTTTAKPRAKTLQSTLDAYHESLKMNEPIEWPELGDGASPHLPTGIYAYCYPFTFDEIVTKCGEAKNNVNATGVYIPMMMEIQMKHDPQWYTKLKELKSKSKLDIVGIAYEKPDWDLITNILMENKGVFSGVMLEWIGPQSCIQNIEPPSMNHLHLIEMATTKQIIRYFVREQEFAQCNTTDPVFLGPKAGINGTLPFPSMVEPVYSCFAGQEGLCYKAFHKYPTEACGGTQRFSFNPYEQAGGRMMHLVNETCHGMPPHDLYGVL